MNPMGLDPALQELVHEAIDEERPAVLDPNSDDADAETFEYWTGLAQQAMEPAPDDGEEEWERVIEELEMEEEVDDNENTSKEGREEHQALPEEQRDLLRKAVEAQAKKTDAERELEDVKQQFRLWSEGKRTRWTDHNIGEVVVSEAGSRPRKVLRVDAGQLKQLQDRQLGWLIRQGILEAAVVESEFAKVKNDGQDKILRTGCIKEVVLHLRKEKQRVTIRIRKP